MKNEQPIVYKENSDTLVKIRYNKKFRFWEALTAAINPKTGEKLQNFGNDWSINGQSVDEVKIKVSDWFKTLDALNL